MRMKESIRLKRVNEPVSVKTGLNGMKMKIYITALLESISFSKRFLKFYEEYHCLLRRCGFLNHIGFYMTL